MIVSTVAGRVRVRSRRLRDASRARAVQAHAGALAGVSSARVNAAAGSLVVIFDPEAVDAAALEDQLEALCLGTPSRARASRGPRLSPALNRATKVGMLSTLGTSVVLGYLGNKRAHIAFGTAFVAIAGLHVLHHQRTLLR